MKYTVTSQILCNFVCKNDADTFFTLKWKIEGAARMVVLGNTVRSAHEHAPVCAKTVFYEAPLVC